MNTVKILTIFFSTIFLSTLLSTSACTNSINVPVDIIVYTDFKCNTCANFHFEVEKELRKRYVSTGQATIEVRLLIVLGDDSQRAAMAALCAADQGKFLEYSDALFENQNKMDSITKEDLQNLAETVGLNIETFSICYESETKLADLKMYRDLAKADNISYLPTVIINNTKVEGTKPLEFYIDLIEQAMD